MGKQIDALLERLEDPNESFTATEVRELMDYATDKASKDIYLQSKLATVMQNSAHTREIVESSMQRLIDLWDATPVTPTLIEVSYEQA